MRVFDNGCFFSVVVTSTEVYAFARRWPCFGSDDAVTFQFDKSNGDLVDIMPAGRSDKSDGTGMCALADDAKAHGIAMLHDRAIAAIRKTCSTTKNPNGSWTIAAVIDGRRAANTYYGYTKGEAVREFCETVLREQRGHKVAA